MPGRAQQCSGTVTTFAFDNNIGSGELAVARRANSVWAGGPPRLWLPKPRSVIGPRPSESSVCAGDGWRCARTAIRAPRPCGMSATACDEPAQSGVRPPDGGRARAAGAGRAGVLSAQEQRARAVCARANVRRITARESAVKDGHTCAGQEPDREWITRCAEGTRAGESSVRACGARSNSERLRRQGTARSGMAQHGGGGWSGPSAPLAPPLKVTEKAPGRLPSTRWPPAPAKNCE